MRGLIFAVAALLAGAAHAGDFAQPMIQSITSTMTVSAISISSQPATSVVGNLKALYRQVCVQNQDAGNFISCGDTVNVSTTVTSGIFGVFLATNTAAAPSQPYCFEVLPGNDFFCRSSSVSGSSRAVIIRKR